MAVAAAKRVLITGAAGNIGQKLCRHLERRGGYELIELDLKSAPNSGIVGADLSVASESWTHLFAGVDCVVHLAAETSSAASWQSLLMHNVVATINVFDAAVRHGVGRVVFASSLQTMDGHEGKARCITPEMPTKPGVNLYATCKVVGEELARAHAQRAALSVICLRLGSVRRGDARPQVGVEALRPQHRWLSTADLCQVFERAIDAEDIDFAVLHVTSQNEGSPWDLSATEDALGYRAQDGVAARSPPLWRRVLDRLRRERARLLHNG